VVGVAVGVVVVVAVVVGVGVGVGVVVEVVVEVVVRVGVAVAVAVAVAVVVAITHQNTNIRTKRTLWTITVVGSNFIVRTVIFAGLGTTATSSSRGSGRHFRTNVRGAGLTTWTF